VTIDTRVFTDTTSTEVPRDDFSLAAELEYHSTEPIAGGELRAKGFFRWDQRDSHLTHGDIRELSWRGSVQRLDFLLGVDTLFWGVTEFDHLIDIVNQTDWVEDPREEVKLGQPMAATTLHAPVGALQLVLLPGFRKRSFPDLAGRLQTFPPTDPDKASFAARNGSEHLDWVARWSYAGSGWDLGVYHFEGTSRSPRFLPGVEGVSPTFNPANARFVLIPRYDLISQDALDAQIARGPWLWKLEAFRQRDNGREYAAATGGFEYTLTGVLGSRVDCGFVSELIRDHRPDGAAGYLQDELALGLRLSANDEQSTEGLVGWITSLHDRRQVLVVDASRRIGSAWKLVIKGRGFRHVRAGDVLYGARDDGYFQMGLTRYL
jgi:hypothetical protein